MNKNKTQEKGDGMVKEHLKVFFYQCNFNRIKPIITLENKHVVISWSSASASVSDNLAPVVQKLDSALAFALAPFRRFPAPLSQFITVTYPRRTRGPRDPKFGRAK